MIELNTQNLEYLNKQFGLHLLEKRMVSIDIFEWMTEMMELMF